MRESAEEKTRTDNGDGVRCAGGDVDDLISPQRFHHVRAELVLLVAQTQLTAGVPTPRVCLASCALCVSECVLWVRECALCVSECVLWVRECVLWVSECVPRVVVCCVRVSVCDEWMCVVGVVCGCVCAVRAEHGEMVTIRNTHA